MRDVCVSLLWVLLAPVTAVDGGPDIRPTIAEGTPHACRLAWHDEFDGDALDTREWEPRTDSKHWSTQKPENLTVSGGMLHLVLKKEKAGKMEYTGAGAISRRTFTHGFYEARFRCPPGKGWHTSFWMQKHDGSGGTDPRAARQEIDVIENDSVNPTHYSTTTHVWNPPPHTSRGHKTVTTPDLSADFHTFGCAFGPRRAVIYLDGRPVQETDVGNFEHGPMNVWLTSIASHLGRTDKVDDAKLPAEAVFDYFRFFEPAGDSASAGHPAEPIPIQRPRSRP